MLDLEGCGQSSCTGHQAEGVLNNGNNKSVVVWVHTEKFHLKSSSTKIIFCQNKKYLGGGAKCCPHSGHHTTKTHPWGKAARDEQLHCTKEEQLPLSLRGHQWPTRHMDTQGTKNGMQVKGEGDCERRQQQQKGRT